MPATALQRTASALLLGFALTACSGDPEPATPSDQASDRGCEALLAQLDDAELEARLAPDLATHADSDGGATVTAGEQEEIDQIAARETAVREAATSAGCL